MREPVKEELEKLISSGAIRKSRSPFSSPAFPIRKRNGQIRLVIDYREFKKYDPDKPTFPNDRVLSINA